MCSGTKLNTSPYIALHDLIHIAETQNSTILCKIIETEDEDKLFMTFHDKCLHEVINFVNPSNFACSKWKYYCTLTPMENVTSEICKRSVMSCACSWFIETRIKNIDQKQTVDDITERVVNLKRCQPLQITTDS